MPTAHERRAKLLPVEELIQRLDAELQRAGELVERTTCDPRVAQSVHAAQGWASALAWQWGHPQLANGTHSAAYVPQSAYQVGEA